MTRSITRQLTRLTRLGLLLAAQIILSRFLSISTPISKISFGFVPIFLAGMLYGPFWGAAVGAASDFLGAQLFPIGAYFPGYTLTAGLVGAVYGLTFHKKPVGWGNTLGAVALISLVLHLGLNTTWIFLTTGYGVLGLLATRVPQIALMAVVQVLVIRTLGSRIPRPMDS